MCAKRNGAISTPRACAGRYGSATRAFISRFEPCLATSRRLCAARVIVGSRLMNSCSASELSLCDDDPATTDAIFGRCGHEAHRRVQIRVARASNLLLGRSFNTESRLARDKRTSLACASPRSFSRAWISKVSSLDSRLVSFKRTYSCRSADRSGIDRNNPRSDPEEFWDSDDLIVSDGMLGPATTALADDVLPESGVTT